MRTPNYSRQFNRRLRDIGIRHFKDLIHDQPSEWLIKNFSKGSDEYPVNVSVLIRNLVWQQRERIKSKEKPPLRELIRTFWYMFVKPVLSRVNALSDNPNNQYRQMIALIADMVTEQQLMKYKDIGFRDENQAHRKVGLNGNIILFSEKLGQQNFLEDIAAKYKISIISLGGKPSILNVEYFVDTLKEAGINMNRSFYIFSIVDFDSHGWIVKNSFIDDLKFYGVRNIKFVDLVHPDLLTPQEIKMSRYRIPQRSHDTYLNKRWLKDVKRKNYKNMKFLIDKRKKTKKNPAGVTLYGLESESISGKRMELQLEKLMIPVLGKKEDYLKRFELENLNNNLQDLMIYKLTGVVK